ncbi:hypothetical protein FORC25_1036 [Clostridium perfringens]|nr:hypothetical protein FORC25_1036 [Clostridium perfringens]
METCKKLYIMEISYKNSCEAIFNIIINYLLSLAIISLVKWLFTI